MILMNYEERTPMKTTLIKLGYAIAIAALLTIFANMIALGVYAFVLIALVCCVAYFHLRTKP
jgi:hypothetical protein|tara:strand:- start:295 stop:480 length:186 start_codon:yes stop_codon:yes gene_type:complete